jgi:hypothetical protein
MSDRENLQAQREAQRAAASSTLSSADRARLWAGMNRYLAAELERARLEKDDDEATGDSRTTSRS